MTLLGLELSDAGILVELLQERYVLETEAYCEERLTRHLHTKNPLDKVYK
jgi:hypothetical protein